MMLLSGLTESIRWSRSNHCGLDSPAGITTPHSHLQYLQFGLLQLGLCNKFTRKIHCHFLTQRSKRECIILMCSSGCFELETGESQPAGMSIFPLRKPKNKRGMITPAADSFA